jgi:hypothetical protein
MKPSGWDVFTGHPAPAPAMLAELSQLRAALPDYDVIVTSRSPAWRFEAIRRPGVPGPGPEPWCVISADPADLWRELAACTRHGASTGVPGPLNRARHALPRDSLTAGSAKARHTAK